MEITQTVKIGAVITEAHPHYAYGLEPNSAFMFKEGDIITTCLEDPPPDREIFVVNEIIDKSIFSVNKPIPDAVRKRLRKLTTITELTARMKDAQTETAITEQNIRDKMRHLFLTEEFTGTIEERLMDGYLYTLCQEDLTASDEERKAVRGNFARPVMVQTGMAGVLEFIKQGKRNNTPESVIARGIWIEMVVEGVRMYVNIKNVRVTKKDEKDTVKTDDRDA